MSYSAAVLADGPALYWRLGEPSGTIANDETANSRDGTYVGTPALGASGALSGDSDTAVTLDGSTQWITSGWSPFAQASSRTFEAWVKRTSTATDDTILGGDGTESPLLRMASGADTLDFHATPGDSVSWASCGIGTGSWRHVALVFKQAAGTAELYVDGHSVSSQALTGDFSASNAGNFLAGAWSDGHHDKWLGGMDEIAVYESALHGLQILAHYEAGTGAAESGGCLPLLGAG